LDIYYDDGSYRSDYRHIRNGRQIALIYKQNKIFREFNVFPFFIIWFIIKEEISRRAILFVQIQI